MLTHQSFSFVQFLLLLLFLSSGCVSIEIINPDPGRFDSTKDIVVSTHDGRNILFRGGNYQIIYQLNNKLIKGYGRLIAAGNLSDRELIFNDTIPFDQIDSIHVRHYSIFHYTGAIIFGIAALCVIILAMMFGGRGIGG
ncbi:MAG: hypothetical protein V1799_15165 [bacterium]